MKLHETYKKDDLSITMTFIGNQTKKQRKILDNQKEINNTKTSVSTKPIRTIAIASIKEHVNKKNIYGNHPKI